MNVIQTTALRKHYGSVEVLHGIDLCVPGGALFGFLGPNGAGKTTTIRILLGLLRATSGRARVFEMDAWTHGPRARRDIGYLPGDISLYPQMTARALLRFLDDARGTSSRSEIERLAELFDLDLSKRVRNCSRGMKQKIGLIQALMHGPRLLILDEPTITLDPLMRDLLLTELRRVADEGRTVMFSSHTLSEVEQLCDWVAIVRGGRIIEQERIEQLRTRAVRHVEIMFEHGEAIPGGVPSGFSIGVQDKYLWKGTWAGPMKELLLWLSRAPVADVNIAPPDLEDLFLAYYTDDRGSSQA